VTRLRWIYQAPSWLTFAAIVLPLVAIALAGQLLVKRAFKARDLSENNTVVSSLLTVVGIVFAVVLGTVVVVVWEGYYRADATAFAEVNAVADMYRYAPALGQPGARILRTDIRRYIDLEISEDWPAMQEGGHGHLTDLQADRLFKDLVGTIQPARGAAQVQAIELNLLQKMLDSRRQTLYVNSGGIPSVLWFALIFGAVLTVGMTFLVGTANFRVHLLLTAGATALLGIMFVLLVDLDSPFRGKAGITSHYWSELRTVLSDPNV
jgi:hypothetical protein